MYVRTLRRFSPLVASVLILLGCGGRSDVPDPGGKSPEKRLESNLHETVMKENIRLRLLSQSRRAESNMRALGTALNTYAVDHNRFPPALTCLTTPVAFMASIPEDPFSTGGETLHYIVSEDGRSCTIYSLGPDHLDDNGTPITGNLTSEAKGDLLRAVELPKEF